MVVDWTETLPFTTPKEELASASLIRAAAVSAAGTESLLLNTRVMSTPTDPAVKELTSDRRKAVGNRRVQMELISFTTVFAKALNAAEDELPRSEV